MDVAITLPAQLRQLLRSLRKSAGLTQSGLAQRLGVVQSRVAAIERDPGSISVEKLLEVLALLNAQLVIRADAAPPSTSGHAQDSGERTAPPPKPATPANPAALVAAEPDVPKGEW